MLSNDAWLLKKIYYWEDRIRNGTVDTDIMKFFYDDIGLGKKVEPVRTAHLWPMLQKSRALILTEKSIAEIDIDC